VAVTTETLLESPSTVALRKKLGVQCPKCGSTRTVTKRAERKFDSFECASCGYAWREPRVVKPPSKVRCVLFMGVVVSAYLVGLEWVPSLSLDGLLALLVVTSVIAVPHELLHALGRWFFGYRAVPVPILLPPILGFTVGEKPHTNVQRFVISSMPLLLTVANWLVYGVTGSERHLMLGFINLFCTAFDILPLILPRRQRQPPPWSPSSWLSHTSQL